ncbi:winged helix DNA-binding domain-containing protein [Gulosibacter sp. 10]|uniref:winged helix DNA-binding domain-containing protein n=1 Tax=Gulosibacter sp. 10 TaxID=1255570 RepID=UPI00097EA4E8|nr:winged helix DNA-binding domain-containing protein [Gulosibacter sp. 10]SJM65672.1 hypothetical protein FM112_11170 [Gulosibacter sp. 10]
MSEQAPSAFPRIAHLRYLAQGLAPGRQDATAFDAARRLLCTQGQHLGGVVAALALRSGGDAAAVEAAFDRGEIVRGYPMRGTVFAAPAEDLQWMNALGGARSVRSANRRREQLGLSEPLLERIEGEILDILAGSERGALSRTEIAEALEARGIPLEAPQRYHVFFTLIALGRLVYGPLRGSEHLVVDAASWLPETSTLEARFNGDELAAIAEWLHRYLRGHGPATIRDFAWWTKLPLGRIRKAAEARPLETELEGYGADPSGEALWGAPGLREAAAGVEEELVAPRLLPPFDELLLGYGERGAIVHEDHHRRIDPARNGVFKPVVYVDGRLIGTWSAKTSGRSRRFEFLPFEADAAGPAAAALEAVHADYPHRG